MITFSNKELLELGKAWLLLSIAFTILFLNPIENGISSLWPTIIIISLITAGLGFVLHELAHKLIAEKYGHKTMFIADNKMLIFALVLSFFGFIFAAPGAVYIQGPVTLKQNGKISVAGPLANLVLALFFLPGAVLTTGIIQYAMSYGFTINSWLGLFNMIPISNFDGRKILRWNKPIFFSVAIVLLIMSVGSQFI